ncbi:CRISPR-associated endonuclease Cas2 [Thiotrichales bacterium HSG14]|nr:CRISPR-associated endonuclease Cas2 [Thiotrichales bacterium HSG14]
MLILLQFKIITTTYCRTTGFRYLGYLFVNSFALDMGDKRTDMTSYIVCYDVGNDKVRDRIAKVLLKYGNRVQYSVFEVMLRSQAELQTLSEKLRAVADKETDIRLYRLCDNCRHAAHDLEGKPIVKMPAVVII